MAAFRKRCLAISAVLLLGCPPPDDSPDDASHGGTADTGDTGAPADLPMGNCSVDEHDPNGGRAEAGRIEQNEELSATLCAGGDETDWYTFTLAVPSYVGVEVLFEKDGQDLPGDAMSCADAGASNETDWAGTLWDFTKVVGEDQLPAVRLLPSDAFQLAWDPGSTTIDAYNNMRHAALVRFPNNGIDFHAAAQANGTNR